MRRAGASLLLLLVSLTLASHPGNTTRRRKTWTREEAALAGLVEGERYVEPEVAEEETTTVSTGGGCPACRMREDMKNYSLEQIKEQILRKLGIEKPPNTTGRSLPKVPSVLLDKYRRSGHAVPGMLGDEPVLKQPLDEEDDFHLKTEKVIAFAQRANHSHSKLRHTKGRGQDVLYFRFSERLTKSRVQKALLWVHVRGAGSSEGEGPGAHVTITVLRVLRGPEWAETALSNIISVKVSRQNDSEGSWVSLDVRKLLEFWLQMPSENLGLVIQASGPPDPLGRTLIVTDPAEDDGAMVPFLEIYVSDKHIPRSKRSIGVCQENSEETRCCRYPLTVDFEAFGWDWIIAPKKYEANYCSGECPITFMRKYTHTYVAWDMAKPPSTGPCCAPRKMKAISMLYFDPAFNIIYGLLPNMVVEMCGCS